MFREFRFDFFVILIVIGIFDARADNGPTGDASIENPKSAICSGCHGAEGNSKNALSPILAGQDPEYIVRQLKEFQNSTRQDPVMNIVASNLSEEEMTALARYFAARTPESAGGNPYHMNQGKMIYQARCWGCHGTNASGQDGYPRLAGQHSEYLIRQLTNFKEGSRKNPAMQAIAIELSLEDITALAAYLGTLNSPNEKSEDWLLSTEP